MEPGLAAGSRFWREPHPTRAKRIVRVSRHVRHHRRSSGRKSRDDSHVVQGVTPSVRLARTRIVIDPARPLLARRSPRVFVRARDERTLDGDQVQVLRPRVVRAVHHRADGETVGHLVLGTGGVTATCVDRARAESVIIVHPVESPRALARSGSLARSRACGRNRDLANERGRVRAGETISFVAPLLLMAARELARVRKAERADARARSRTRCAGRSVRPIVWFHGMIHALVCLLVLHVATLKTIVNR